METIPQAREKEDLTTGKDMKMNEEKGGAGMDTKRKEEEEEGEDGPLTIRRLGVEEEKGKGTMRKEEEEEEDA